MITFKLRLVFLVLGGGCFSFVYIVEDVFYSAECEKIDASYSFDIELKEDFNLNLDEIYKEKFDHVFSSEEFKNANRIDKILMQLKVHEDIVVLKEKLDIEPSLSKARYVNRHGFLHYIFYCSKHIYFSSWL
jgi:hypothetical protein